MGRCDIQVRNITPSYKLDVNGTISAINVSPTSDDRIKYNEEDIPNAMSLISQLKPQFDKIHIPRI